MVELPLTIDRLWSELVQDGLDARLVVLAPDRVKTKDLAGNIDDLVEVDVELRKPLAHIALDFAFVKNCGDVDASQGDHIWRIKKAKIRSQAVVHDEPGCLKALLQIQFRQIAATRVRRVACKLKNLLS